MCFQSFRSVSESRVPALRSAWRLWLAPLLLASLACGIVVQSTTVVHEDESSTTEVTVAMERTLLSEPSVASRWQALIAEMTAGLDERGAVVVPYDDGRLNGLQASLSFPDLESASATLSGDELSLFDSFTLKRWRGEIVFEAHTTSALIRQRVQQITGLSEAELLLVQFPLYLSLQLPGTFLYSNADQTAPGGVQTWAINWLADSEHTLHANSQVPLISPVITEPAAGTRIRDASAGVDFAGTGEPGADLGLYRVEGDARTELARGVVGTDRQWRLDGVRLGEPGQYSLSVEERTDNDTAASEQSVLEYRPLEPIVFVPGYYACSAGLTGEDVNWEIGPAIRQNFMYTGLIPLVYTKYYGKMLDHFAAMGYQFGKDLFVACYDWSASLPAEAETFARTLDRAWRENPAHLPVTVLTHSNGGLVARYYIQTHSEQTAKQISSLIMIAPPNRGVLRAYYAWEGGDISKEDGTVQMIVRASLTRRCGGELFSIPLKQTRRRGQVIRNPNYEAELLAYQKKVHNCLRNGNTPRPIDYDIETARDESIPSMAWLLPDWDFLREGAERPYRGSPLQRVNSPEGIAALFAGVQGKIYVLAGEMPGSTPAILPVATRPDGDSPLWENGKPAGNPVPAAGDDTILVSSAALPHADRFGDRYAWRPIPHAHHAVEMIKDNLVIAAITNYIKEDFPVTVDDAAISDIVIVWVESPVDLLVTDAQGRRVGVDSTGRSLLEIPDAAYGDTADPLGPKFIVIPDPAEGEYQFQVTGQAEGHYELYGLSSASDEPVIAVSDSIATGEVKTYTAKYSAAPPATQPASRRWILWTLVGIVGLSGVGWVAARRGRRRRTEFDAWNDSYADSFMEPPRRKPWWKRRKKDDFPSDD